MTGVAAPSNLTSLRARVRNAAIADAKLTRRLELIVADAAVGQMLPPGVVKGGAAIKIRLGEAETRATRDLDAARAADLSLEAYLELLDERLAAGWAGFTGTVRDLDGPSPRDVPVDYVMHPFQIRLSYRGSFWFNITFELGRDEIGSPDRFRSCPSTIRSPRSFMHARGWTGTVTTTVPMIWWTSSYWCGRRDPISAASVGRLVACSNLAELRPGHRQWLPTATGTACTAQPPRGWMSSTGSTRRCPGPMSSSIELTQPLLGRDRVSLGHQLVASARRRSRSRLRARSRKSPSSPRPSPAGRPNRAA
jgi:hypothetical protein